MFKIKQMHGAIFLLLTVFFVSCSSSGGSGNAGADINLPPDPGIAGEATLEGIDSDKDGVRDDIQRYILQTYPNEPQVQKAMFQVAKGYQAMVLGSADKETAYAADKSFTKGRDCLYFIYDRNLDKLRQEDSKLEAQFLNTKDRIQSYLATDKLLSGGIFGLTPNAKLKEQCEF